jgi:YbbR domain-containing protein
MLWILRNWHLKIAALALATILYTGLVFSGSFTEGRMAGVSIERINQPNGTYVTSQQLATLIVSYRVAADAAAPVTVDTFAATIDLSKYDMRSAGQAQSLPVTVRSLNDAVTVLSWQPQSIPVVLDTLATNPTVRVLVDHGTVPAGLEVGTPTITPSTVTATGPRAQLNQVVQAVAAVAIDTSGIDVNQQVDLRAVDANGAQVESVELNPASVLVQISVRTVETNKTVPVRPAVTGNPAVGYEIRGIASNPPIITLRGAPAALSGITEVTTQPFSVSGLAATKAFKATLIIPKGLTLSPDHAATVTVTVAVAPQTGSRTFLVGVTCTGAQPGTSCLPQLSQISVTLAGPIAALAGLKAAQLTPTLDVSGLGPGEHNVTPVLSLPAGISVLAFSPAQVPVVIQPAATPTPGG